MQPRRKYSFMDEFSEELNELQHRLRRSVGYQDVKYIRNAEIAGRLCTLVGFATAWLLFNPLSILLVAIGQFARWGIAHHILHLRSTASKDARPVSAAAISCGWRRMITGTNGCCPPGFSTSTTCITSTPAAIRIRMSSKPTSSSSEDPPSALV